MNDTELGSSETDETLCAALGRGEAALEVLLARHWPDCFRAALSILRDPSGAEDAAQVAFVRLVEAGRRGTRLDPVGAWLRTVVVNEARMILRSSKRRARRERSSARPERTTDSRDAIEGVRDLVESLPEKLRVPVLLHFALGLSHAEVAAALSVTKPTASTWIRSGVDRLRASLPASVALSLTDDLFVRALSVSDAPLASAPDASAIMGRVGFLARRARPSFSKLSVSTALAGGVVLAASSGVALLISSKDTPRPVVLSSPKTPTNVALVDSGSSVANATPLAAPSPESKLESRTSVALASLPTEELEPPSPAYPWPRAATPNETALALERIKVSVNFEETPLLEALDQLHELTSLELKITPAARPAIEEKKPRVNLRLREVAARITLDLVLGQAEDLELRGDARPEGVSIARGRVAPSEAPFAWVPHLLSQGAREDHWRSEYQRRLETQHVTCNFARRCFAEVVEFFQDISGLNITVSKAIDPKREVTFEVHDVFLGEALDAVLAKLGLKRQFKDETLAIVPVEERDPPPFLADRRVTLDLRGVQVVDLVRALERQGITAVCSEETWESRGTFSVHATDMPISDFVLKLHGATPLTAWVAEHEGEPGPDGERAGVLVVGGTVPSVRRALEAPVPGFAGVAAEIQECRARLASALASREKARRDRDLPIPALDEIEGQVETLARRVSVLLDRSAAIATARERLAALEHRDRETVRPELASARSDAHDLEALERGEPLSFGAHAARKSPTFFFLGTRLTNRYFNRVEIERAIVSFGGSVVKELGPRPHLDYVVVLWRGEEDRESLDLALDLGASMLSERELLDAIPALRHAR